MTPRLLAIALLLFHSRGTAQEQNTAPDDRDEAIKVQLETIFSNVDDLKNITVTATNGVVRLVGDALAEEHLTKAEGVAKGIDGVVYVDNDIALVTDVSQRLSPTLERMIDFLNDLRANVPLYGLALIVLVIAYVIARIFAGLFARSPILRTNALLRGIVESFLKVIIILVGLYLALEIAGATAVVGAVIGAAGVAGLALSFAFRDIIENYLASVLLSLRQPFAIKDLVQINGHECKVIRLTSSETVLMTIDGNHVRIPNAEVFKGTIINLTRNPSRRFEFAVGIGTNEDLIRAQDIGVATLADLPGVVDEPPPNSIVQELGDSSVVVNFHGWVDQGANDFRKVRGHAVRMVKAALDSEGVSKPVPIYELNIPGQTTMPDVTEARQELTETTKAIGREVLRKAASADLAVDRHIDEQIDQEKAAEPDEEDLLVSTKAE